MLVTSSYVGVPLILTLLKVYSSTNRQSISRCVQCGYCLTPVRLIPVSIPMVCTLVGIMGTLLIIYSVTTLAFANPRFTIRILDQICAVVYLWRSFCLQNHQTIDCNSILNICIVRAEGLMWWLALSGVLVIYQRPAASSLVSVQHSLQTVLWRHWQSVKQCRLCDHWHCSLSRVVTQLERTSCSSWAMTPIWVQFLTLSWAKTSPADSISSTVLYQSSWRQSGWSGKDLRCCQRCSF